MGLTRSLIRAEARHSVSPRSILMNINQLLLEMSQSDMFVTVFYGLLDMAAGVLRYSRAGHDCPLLISSRNGDCRLLGGQGIALGVMEDIELDEIDVEVHPGELLVLYTDGIVDAQSQSGEQYGQQRLKDSTRCNEGNSAELVCDRIFTSVQEFIGTNMQFDDMALLVASFSE